MLVAHVHDILVRFSDGRQTSLWVVLRGQDVNPADEDEIRMVVDFLRQRDPPRFSVCRARFGGGYELHQDVGEAVARHEFPDSLLVIADNFRNGGLFVTDRDGSRVLDSAQAFHLFKEALRWCDDEYSDLLPEFADQIDAHLQRKPG